MIRSSIFWLNLYAFCFLLPEGKSAEAFVFKAVADTTLRREFPQNNYGGDWQIHAGDWAVDKGRVALMKFDLSELPQTGTIVYATLRLKADEQYSTETLELRRVLRNWGEGTKIGSVADRQEATWESARHLEEAWTSPGGQNEGTDIAANISDDFGEQVRGGQIFSSANERTNLIADIERWRTGPNSNFGWMLRQRISTFSQQYSRATFRSSEQAGDAPELKVYLGDPDVPRVLVNSELITEEGLDFGTGIHVQIDPAFQNDLVFYTLDGSEPTVNSRRDMWRNIKLTNSAVLRVLNYSDDFSRMGMSPAIPFRHRPAYKVAAYSEGGGLAYLGLISGGAAPEFTDWFTEYFEGSLFQVTAVPGPGFVFCYWTSGVVDTNSPVTTLILDTNKTVAAVFGYPLRTTIQGEGELVMDPPGGRYRYESYVKITPVPSRGYYFAQWGFGGNQVPLSIRIFNDTSLSALFLPLGTNQATLTIRTEGAGKVTGIPIKNVYAAGEYVTLVAQPQPGYRFLGWSGDVTGTSLTATIQLPAGLRVVTARFEGHVPLAVRKESNGIVLQFMADEHLAYVVQRSEDLRTWTDVEEVKGAGEIQKSYGIPGSGYSFYRLRVAPAN